ncbi:protein dpy-30 homolog isoform X1 [Callithrix jacchus]|uniref:protein dpy-30 homolog isoform X1 n=1 Tax=Callithrix jacchus TaxID=9483 RepID=UPI0004F009BB|nr:protein dpy-30 homolog isoform X1 [Callithrix jacchus]
MSLVASKARPLPGLTRTAETPRDRLRTCLHASQPLVCREVLRRRGSRATAVIYGRSCSRWELVARCRALKNERLGRGLVSGDCDLQGPPWSQSRCWRDKRRLQKILTLSTVSQTMLRPPNPIEFLASYLLKNKAQFEDRN